MIVTLLFALGAGGLGQALFGRWTLARDPAARFGLHGLLGLGFLGWITLPIGLLPGGLRWGVGVVGLLALLGLVALVRNRPRAARPTGQAALGLLVLIVAGLLALVGVLAPSDALDWDSLAYHLAVPKIWLAAGRIEFVSSIHHSNFPFLIDNLYVWGETWGGPSGAKAFSWAYAAYGAFAVFGLARERYGEAAGWWSSVAYATVPMVLWEAGTGYVDVAHALFGGLGIWLAASMMEAPSCRPGKGLPDSTDVAAGDERGLGESRKPSDNAATPSPTVPPSARDGQASTIDGVSPRLQGEPSSEWLLPALLLGGAVGSKYTALQTLSILVVALLACALLKRGNPAIRDPRSSILKTSLVALAIGSPWYVRNMVDTGNPVYPFFYSKLGGRNWDAFQETIYKDQQQTFGSGRPMAEAYTSGPLEPARLGSSVLGTAYAPGRYADPAPTAGLGFPFVGLGAIPVTLMLAWMLSGRARRVEGVCLAVAAASFFAWFFLSQQARYAFVWCVPLVVMAGGAVVRLAAGRVVAGAIALQAAVTLFVATNVGDTGGSLLGQKLRVALGTEDADAYQTRRLGFYAPSKFLNETAKGGRVALFDEVFGFLLDVPYFWAGPGHTTELGYATMKNGDELVAALKKQGITHAYFALGTAFQGRPDEADRWIRAAGLSGPAVPYTGADREGRLGDERSAYKVFLAEAVASGALRPLQEFRGRRIVFEVR